MSFKNKFFKGFQNLLEGTEKAAPATDLFAAAAAAKAGAKAAIEAKPDEVPVAVALWLPAGAVNNRLGDGLNAIVYAMFNLADPEQVALLAKGLPERFPGNLRTAMAEAPYVNVDTYLMSRGDDANRIEAALAPARKRNADNRVKDAEIKQLCETGNLDMKQQAEMKAEAADYKKKLVGLNGEDPNKYITNFAYVTVMAEVYLRPVKRKSKDTGMLMDVLEIEVITLHSVEMEHPARETVTDLSTLQPSAPRKRSAEVNAAAESLTKPAVTLDEQLAAQNLGVSVG